MTDGKRETLVEFYERWKDRLDDVKRYGFLATQFGALAASAIEAEVERQREVADAERTPPVSRDEAAMTDETRETGWAKALELEVELACRTRERDEALDRLVDMVAEHCTVAMSSEGRPAGAVDSMESSSNPNAMHLLARAGLLIIDRVIGLCRFIGHWPAKDGKD